MPKPAFSRLSGKKQDAFFDLALEAFAYQPYSQASLSALLKKAGMAKGTFYQYFTGKLDLYDYLVNNVFTLKQFYLKSHMPANPDDFFHVFEALLRLETGFRLQHPSFHSLLLFATDQRLSPLSPQRIEEIKNHHQKTLHPLMVRHQLKGSIATDADASLVIFFCQVMMDEFYRYVRLQMQTKKEASSEASESITSQEIANASRRFMKLFRRGISGQHLR